MMQKLTPLHVYCIHILHTVHTVHGSVHDILTCREETIVLSAKTVAQSFTVD